MKDSQDIGRALFFVEPMPMGPLGVFVPKGCALVYQEEDA